MYDNDVNETYCSNHFTIYINIEYLHCIPETNMLYTNYISIYKKKALAGVAQWIERGPVNRRVAGLIPSQGTYLGCRPGPQ